MTLPLTLSPSVQRCKIVTSHRRTSQADDHAQSPRSGQALWLPDRRRTTPESCYKWHCANSHSTMMVRVRGPRYASVMSVIAFSMTCIRRGSSRPQKDHRQGPALPLTETHSPAYAPVTIGTLVIERRLPSTAVLATMSTMCPRRHCAAARSVTRRCVSARMPGYAGARRYSKEQLSRPVRPWAQMPSRLAESRPTPWPWVSPPASSMPGKSASPAVGEAPARPAGRAAAVSGARAARRAAAG